MHEPPKIYVRLITLCPTCETRRRFAGFDAMWYGPTLACLGCGDSFSDGERAERPFARGWRKKSIAKAEEWWAKAVRLNGDEHRQWFVSQLADVVARDLGGVA